MSKTDLESRIMALLDGGLSAEESAELGAVLLSDGEARETYEEIVLLHNALEARYAYHRGGQKEGVVPMDRLVADQQRRVVRMSLLAAAAILLISAGVMWIILAPRQVPSVGVLRTAAGSVYSLVYEGEGDPPGGDQLVAGSVVRLEKGTMEGIFESGVRLVAEAPCSLRVISGERVAQEEGRAWFQVPSVAAGFTVVTPELEIVDLGTEFGVVAAAGGRDEVHVMRGSVEVSPAFGHGSKRRLDAGSALRVAADGGFQQIEPEGSRFARDLGAAREIAVVNHSFEADVVARDGDRATKESGKDDYDKELLPAGWLGFDDGDGGIEGTRGVLSTAPDSYFRESLAASPDDDANDQVFFSAARDIYQVLAEPVGPNRTYILRVDIGDRMTDGPEGAPGSPGFRLGIGTDPGKRLLEPAATDFPLQIDGDWVTWSTTYLTGPEVDANEPLRIELTSGSRVGWFDNVRLSVTR